MSPTTGGPATPPRVPGSIREQRRRLAERVTASGLYRHEVPEFEVATTAYADLVTGLGIAEDLGNLTSPESRNLVRRVRRHDGTEAVLKVVGNTREPGEGEVLAAWSARGLPCARPLAWGYHRLPPAGGGSTAATWLLNRHVPGEVLGDGAGTGGLADRAARLLGFLAPFHASGTTVGAARSWSERLAPHLHEVVPLIERAGLRQPQGWRERLAQLSARGRTLVHADPAGINVVVGPDGRWTLIDPPGAVVAMREADAGQIAWHTGRAAALEAAVDAVCDADRTLLPGAVASFAAFNLVVEAGYELADHARAAGGDGPRERDARPAQDLLDRAAALLAQS